MSPINQSEIEFLRQAIISLWLPICCNLSPIWILPNSASSPAAYLGNSQPANFDAVEVEEASERQRHCPRFQRCRKKK